MENKVAIREPAGKLAMTEITAIANAFHTSGMFPDIHSQAQAAVKIMAGQELGFNPIYSMMKISIVRGKVTVAAETLGAMVKRSGRYDYKVAKLTDTECDMQFYELCQHVTEDVKTWEPVFLSRFTMDDAKRADLVKPDSGWVKWPRAMLVSKAVSQGARIVCPDIISGVYTPEDFGYSTNPTTQTVEGIVTNDDDKADNDKQADEAAQAATFAQMQSAVDTHDKTVDTPIDNPPNERMTLLRADMVKINMSEGNAIGFLANTLHIKGILAGDNFDTAFAKATIQQQMSFRNYVFGQINLI